LAVQCPLEAGSELYTATFGNSLSIFLIVDCVFDRGATRSGDASGDLAGAATLVRGQEQPKSRHPKFVPGLSHHFCPIFQLLKLSSDCYGLLQ
jgi:hypothetical protein